MLFIPDPDAQQRLCTGLVGCEDLMREVSISSTCEGRRWQCQADKELESCMQIPAAIV